MLLFYLLQHHIEEVLIFFHVFFYPLGESPHLKTDKSSIKPHRLCSVVTFYKSPIQCYSSLASSYSSLYPDDGL